MAKYKNMWLHGASQQIGGAVIYNLKGQTVARSLASSVSNPRTPAQMTQRIKLGNVVAMYKASRGWISKGFPSKPQRFSDYNAFVRANLATSRVALTKQEVAAGAAVVAPYIVSQGSLAPIEANFTGTTAKTNLFCGSLAIGPSTTVGQLATALISNNIGVREGMQLSFVQYIQSVSEAGVPYVVCRAYEIILDPTSNELLSQYFPIALFGVSNDADSALTVAASDWVGGFALVLSETTSAKTEVSTETIVMTPNNTTYAAHCTDAAIAAAIASYGESTEVFLDSRAAEGQNTNVAVSGGLLAVSFDGTTIPAGGTLEGKDLVAGVDIISYFNTVMPDTEDVAVRIGRVGSDEFPIIGRTMLYVSGTSIMITTSGPLHLTGRPGEITDWKMSVTVDGTEYMFYFKVDETDAEN